MIEPATLHLYCQHCGGDMSLQFAGGTEQASSGGAIPTSWFCPYCEQENRMVFHARLKWVTRREPDLMQRH